MVTSLNQIRKYAYKIKFFLIKILKNKNIIFKIGKKSKISKRVSIKLHRKGKFIIGNNTEIRENSIFESNGIIKIGNKSTIGSFNWFQGSGEIIIGDNVIIGPHCSIISTSHEYDDSNIPFKDQNFIKGNILIGDNVWIGSHVVILHNIKIGKNVVIGANSLVNRDINDNSVVAGSPAKTIKQI